MRAKIAFIFRLLTIVIMGVLAPCLVHPPSGQRRLALAATQDLVPIRYDDCGSLGRQPHVLGQSTWTFGEEEVKAGLSCRTVAFDGSAVSVRYERLEPNAQYRIRVVYATERGRPRAQSLYAGNHQLHPIMSLPDGEARTFEFPIPAEAVATGALQLSFRHETGPNAVVSEVWLLSNSEQPELRLMLESDLRGKLTAMTWSGLLEPSNSEIMVAGPGGVRLQRTTKEGRVDIDLKSTFGETSLGEVVVTAQQDKLEARQTLPLDSLFFRRPILTPLPSEVPGLRRATISLSGEWRFSPSPAARFQEATFDDSGWAKIAVPGEWVMQGFNVSAYSAAGYRLTFQIPATWSDKTVKIRFDAVYSKCRVLMNGTVAGEHEGGFTPFEVDVSETVRKGARNVLAVEVTSESMADVLASASGYARHPLGGITRGVTALALNRTHLQRFHLDTYLDDRHRDAELVVFAQVTGEVERSHLRLALRDPRGIRLPLQKTSEVSREEGGVTMHVPVRSPLRWSAEHPNLYTLTGELLCWEKVVERVSRRFGFREVEVPGAELLVNGKPVKLRGTCRHEVDPQRGRSLTPEVWKRDIELLKGANINYVRTAHYPPAEEFLNLCDEAGIYVQDEAPWCWVNAENASSPKTLGMMLRSNAEMIERDRSHPSVILWDLANESSWGENFYRIHTYTRSEDPSRPTLFSGASDADPGHAKPEGVCEIASWHYPGPGGAAQIASSKRPVIFDEYCHLNCYNPEEVTMDPGLREYWGRALLPMWDEMQQVPSCLGGALWCWADDVFDLPGNGRVGYGEWGVVDGWRRPKPEWWHVRMTYSPLRVGAASLLPTEPGKPLIVPVENRFDFTNLQEIQCSWRVGSRRGLLNPDIPPHSVGKITIPTAAVRGNSLSLEFRDRSGKSIHEVCLPVGVRTTTRMQPSGLCPGLEETTGGYRIVGKRFSVLVDRSTGQLRAQVRGTEVLVSGPCVAAGRLGTAGDAFLDKDPAGGAVVSAVTEGQCVKVNVKRSTGFGRVEYAVRVYGDGDLCTDYQLSYSGADVPVRDVGLQWGLPSGFTILGWYRRGQWTEYPGDHIGRLIDWAQANPNHLPSGFRLASWSFDPSRRGTNDFRSTKYNILEASLTNPSHIGVRVLSNGSQHARAWVEGDRVVLRVDDFANGGGEGFLSGHYAKEMRTVRTGESISGSVRLQLVGGRSELPGKPHPTTVRG